MVNKQEIVILGPTASGKTRLAVALAKKIKGSILSADSRQVYRGLDIGTGKDLHEFGEIPYYLIDCIDAGERFNVSRFLALAEEALTNIRDTGRQPIICGGTGLYIQGLIQGFAYSEVPVDEVLRQNLSLLSLHKLQQKLKEQEFPANFQPDTSTHKRCIRALEICQWMATHPEYKPEQPYCPNAKVFGLAPPRQSRRNHISDRLKLRLDKGLIDEVKGLLDAGLTPEQLIYYGLEYKYTTQYLLGELNFDTFFNRLETEIHRFAKRQMTFFRKMEKDGINIHWLTCETLPEQVEEILSQQ